MIEKTVLGMVEASDLPEGCRDLVDVVGLEVVMDIVDYCGGGSIYFPSRGAVVKNARNRVIRIRFDGGNYRELGSMFGISDTQVRSIVN